MAHTQKKYLIACWHKALWFVGLMLLVTGCSKSEKEPIKLSAQYQEIFKHTAVIHDKYSPDSALKYLDSAFRAMPSHTLVEQFDRLGFHYAVRYTAYSDFNKAYLYADSIITLINKNGGQQKYPEQYANARLALGDAAFQLKDYNRSYQNFFDGYQVGKNQLDQRVTAEFLYRMGMVTYKQAHYVLAVKYFKESLALIANNHDRFTVYFRNQELMDNIGMAYYRLNKPDSAIAYYNRAFAYIDKNAGRFPEKAYLTPIAHAVIYGNQADVYIKKGDYHKAIPLLKNSIAINSVKGRDRDNNDALVNEIKLAEVYGKIGDDAMMLDQLKEIQQQLLVIKNKDVQKNWYRLMGDYYDKKNDLANALSYNKKFNALRDSIDANEQLLRETNVTEQLNNFEKEHQIALLKNNYRIQRIYLAVAVIFGIMAVIIVFLVYRNWLRSKEDLNTVNKLNTQVNEQKVNLEHTLEKLHESSLEKDRILHAVAHDLRNPLGGIASLSNMMAGEDDCSPEQLELINIIKETADNSLELINEIFEATDAFIDESKKQAVDINLLLNNIVELLKFKAAEKNQQIILTTIDGPVVLRVNREKIWRVLSNLIINAIKFSPVGVNIELNVSDNEEVLIAVKDHGIGIPEDMRSKVFNMFTDAKRPGTMGEKSFGLGLSISKQIVEAHGGRIWFKSNTDGGTTFYVALKKTLS